MQVSCITNTPATLEMCIASLFATHFGLWATQVTRAEEIFMFAVPVARRAEYCIRDSSFAQRIRLKEMSPNGASLEFFCLGIFSVS